ncbi:MAG: family 65 glycosyl hydrolase [Lachnospiraceae bacterium]|nr:family 65 glycosyl hydrolase [Lachnospiraceae bacterium]
MEKQRIYGEENMTNSINYAKGQGREKNWLIEETDFCDRYTGKCEAIFTQGNGYLGLRNALEERYLKETRNLFVAGTFNKASDNEVTELPNAPDIVNTEMEFNGERFAMNRGRAESYSRTLNLRTGETVRTLIWESPKGDRVSLAFHRFVSLDNVHIIGNYIEITPLSGSMELSVQSGIDAQVTNSGAQHFTEGARRLLEEKYLELPVTTTESKVGICVHAAHRVFTVGNSPVQSPTAGETAGFVKSVRAVDERRCIYSRYELSVPVGQTIRFEKISTVHSTRDLEYVELTEEEAAERLCEDGRALIRLAEEAGYDRLFADSFRAWEDFWKEQDIQIGGSDRDQLAIRFALYHLRIMTRKEDSRIGIAAKGLSGEGYKGHSFWDTETFIFPYFQMADPDTARTLLEYRYRGLYGARKKAKENGYEGAMYPWESAWVSDGEVTPWLLGLNVHTGEPLYCYTGLIELHITADIIYALWQYYTATGDEEFMERCGYEMILDTARFWNSRLEWVAEHDRYEIRDVIGPDEYKEHVDNNAYTNYLVRYNMELAVSVIDRLIETSPVLYDRLEAKLTDLVILREQLKEKLEKLYLPQPDKETGIIPQFDGYSELKDVDLTEYRQSSVVGTFFRDYSVEDVQHMKAGKQADVVELLYQLEDLADPEVKRSNYLYYEARTLHDSSLSKAIHSIMACDLGMSDEAYEMFRRAADTDMGQEMKSSDAGIHSANMGGIWQDVVMGFGGVRISRGRLRICPHLPEQWEQLTYPVCWRGNRLTVTVRRGEIQVLNEGQAVEIEIAGSLQTVSTGEMKFSI